MEFEIRIDESSRERKEEKQQRKIKFLRKE